MIFVGIDTAASKGVALAGFDDAGERLPSLFTSPVFKQAGARRLSLIREWVYDTTPAGTAAAVVELPFSPRSSFVLPSVAAVCMEAVQAKCPKAVVLEMPPSRWRKEFFGVGNAGKERAVAVADNAGLIATEDEAEALCMALVARQRWMAAVAA